MKKIIVISIVALLAIPIAFAAPPKCYARPVKKSTYTRPRQQHFSFIPPKPVFEPYNPPPFQQPQITKLSGQVTKQASQSANVQAMPQLLPPMPKTEPPKAVAIATTDKNLNARVKKSQAKAPKIKERSWVTGVNADQARPIASSLASFLSKKLSPQNTMLLLAPPTNGQEDNPFTPQLIEKLRLVGFGIVDSTAPTPQAVVLQYQISRLNDGIWAQISIKGSEINRYYPLQNLYDLANATPFSEREVNAP